MVSYTDILFRGENNATTINNLENIIESSLVRADELKALLNNVKNDSQTATDVLLPQLAEHCKQLLRVFQVIDSLCHVVSMLPSSATELNEKLQKVQQFTTCGTRPALVGFLANYHVRHRWIKAWMMLCHQCQNGKVAIFFRIPRRF